MDVALGEDEKKAVAELRFLLKNDIPSSVYDDVQLLKRFLIAREYNVKKAEFMLRRNLRWQKEMQLQNLEDVYVPEVLTKYYSMSLIGHAKDGNPVVYTTLTNLDEKGLLKSTNLMQLRKYSVKLFESYLARKKPVESGGSTQILFIYNVSQVSISRILNKRVFYAVMKLLTEFQDNYPERIKSIFVINASPSFAAVWSIVKEWVGSSLIKKIAMYEEAEWKEELLKRIDADVLPAFLGGTRTDPDGNPLCLTTVNHGGLIPEEYFVKRNTDEFLQNPGATSAIISRHKQLTVPVEVTESNRIVHWEFIVKSFDIGFGLSKITQDGGLEEIIPVHKLETECLSEQGKFRCKSPGRYCVIFDNSYSWIHSKEIYYRIWIT